MNRTSLLHLLEEIIINASDSTSISLSIDDSIDTVDVWDSLVTVSIAAALTEELGTHFDLDDLEKLTSVKGIMDILKIE